MIVGYARVSTTEQHVDGQVEQLRAAGAERVFAERGSGRNDERPDLTACLAGLQAGDTLVIVALDRLGRSTSHLVRTGHIDKYLANSERRREGSQAAGQQGGGWSGVHPRPERSYP